MEEQRKRFDWLPEIYTWWQYEQIMEDRERWQAIREGWRGNSSLPNAQESRLHKDRHVINTQQK